MKVIENDYIKYILVSLIMGFGNIAILPQVKSVASIDAVAVRFFIASIVLFLWINIYRKKSPYIKNKKLHILSAIEGIFLFALSYTCTYEAVKYYPTGITALFLGLFCIPTLLIEIITKDSKEITWVNIVGILMSASGVVFVMLSDEVQISFNKGMYYIISGVLVYSIGTHIRKYILNHYDEDPEKITAHSMLYGSIFLSIYIIIFGDSFKGVLSQRVDYLFISSLLYLVIAASIISFLLYSSLIKSMGPARASTSYTLGIIISIFGSTIFEGLEFSYYGLSVIIMIATSIILINYSKQQKT